MPGPAVLHLRVPKGEPGQGWPCSVNPIALALVYREIVFYYLFNEHAPN